MTVDTVGGECVAVTIGAGAAIKKLLLCLFYKPPASEAALPMM